MSGPPSLTLQSKRDTDLPDDLVRWKGGIYDQRIIRFLQNGELAVQEFLPHEMIDSMGDALAKQFLGAFEVHQPQMVIAACRHDRTEGRRPTRGARRALTNCSPSGLADFSNAADYCGVAAPAFDTAPRGSS